MPPTFTVSLGSRQLFRGDASYLDEWLAARRRITFFSVCSGIEAASVAWKPLGWKHVGFAEIEKFPSAVLAHHYPTVPNYGDFTKVNTRRLPRIDILCGGTPCQSFSIAGARRSLDDARGNLTLAFVDLAHDLADNNGLRNVVWENVPGVLSTKDNAFGCFLAGLVGADDALPSPEGKRWPSAGMVSGPKGRAAWRVLDAQYFGLAQRRKRVIVVADFGNGADPAAVLFEPESVPRHSPPSRETGERVAPTISARPTGGGGLGTDFDLDGGLVPSAVPDLARTLLAKANDSCDHTLQTYAPPIARCVATREGSSQDYESTTMVAISHALKAEGADASEDGTGRGTPIIAFHHNTQVDQLPSAGRKSTYLDPLTRSQGAAVAYSVALRGREDGATAELGSDVAFALRAAGGGGDKPHILTSAVRRLTPRECERLMGFQFLVSPHYPRAWQDSVGRWWSPDYTAIPWRGKPAALCPDGPRYKALGNSWAVPKFRWLGERIARFMPPR